jgi:hypothetical protein
MPNPNPMLQMDMQPSLLGVVNLLPPSLLQPTDMFDAQNRLSQNDGINRPRPGKDLVQALPISINRCNGFRHFHDQEFILGVTNVSNQSKWYSFTGVSSGPPYAGTFTALTTGSPPNFTTTANLYSTVGLSNYFVCANGLVYQYNDTTWTQVNVGAITQNFNYPMWFSNRLFVVSQNAGSKNTIYGSVILPNFSLSNQWDTVNLAIQLDESVNDQVVALFPYLNFTFLAFKTNSIYQIGVYPPSMVGQTGLPSFAASPITKLAGSIGCCEQNTVAAVGNDVYFLSESGRGVYSINSLAQISQYLTSGLLSTSEAQVFEAAISRPVQKYIDRINWSAISRSHAAAWDDLYVLSVPIDGSTVCNALLVYCVGTKKWQGIWNSYPDDAFAVQRIGSAMTDLYFVGTDSNLYRQWHAADKVWYDTNAGNTSIPVLFNSSLSSRGFKWGQNNYLVQPFNFLLDFVDTPIPQGSQSTITPLLNGLPVTVGFIKDNSNTIPFVDQLLVGTGVNFLPLAGLPFNLDDERLFKSVSARKAGTCEELQVTLSGAGPWCIYRISGSAWISRQVTNV